MKFMGNTFWAHLTLSRGVRQFQVEDGLQLVMTDGAEFATIRRIPSKDPVTWRGPEDGLPPVRTVCDVLNSTLGSPKWERCTILYSGKKRVMYDSESCEERVAFIEDLKFRKARTPEQIKAEQHERAVAKLAAVIRDSGWESPEILAAYLDSHGYCKFEIVDEQP